MGDRRSRRKLQSMKKLNCEETDVGQQTFANAVTVPRPRQRSDNGTQSGATPARRRKLPRPIKIIKKNTLAAVILSLTALVTIALADTNRSISAGGQPRNSELFPACHEFPDVPVLDDYGYSARPDCRDMCGRGGASGAHYFNTSRPAKNLLICSLAERLLDRRAERRVRATIPT